MKIRLLFLAPLLMASPAWADDAEVPLMESEWCVPMTTLNENIRKFDRLDADKRDRVGASIEYTFDLAEGELPPERVELRDGEALTPIPLTQRDQVAKSGNIVPLVRAASDEAEVCVVDPAREGRPRSAPGYSFDFGFAIRWLETPGTHTLEELEDGGKDGRSHYRKMVGAMGFMVPKFDHVAVAGHDADNPPRVFAVADGVDIGEPESEFLNGGRLIDLDDLEDMGADGIRIEGDYYRMTPSPSAKTVRRFMSDNGEAEEE